MHPGGGSAAVCDLRHLLTENLENGQGLAAGGATGTVPVYTGSATVGNSPIAVSGGNVGIGTTNPGAPLHVISGSTVANPSAIIENDGATASSLLYFQNSDRILKRIQ
jgi:hypothetical protein